MSSGKPCKNCGHATDIYDKYCVNCGIELKGNKKCQCYCYYCQNCEEKRDNL